MDNAGIAALLRAASWEATLALSDNERMKMDESVRTLSQALSQGREVYGVTQGFGPLVGYNADYSPTAQGLGLISHLAVGQGAPLSPGVTRLMLWLRLSGMKHGYSAVPVEFWLKLATLWNRGFTPVVPCEGSVSASGDLVPLAHAALAFAGVGEAWDGSPPAGWTRVSAQRALAAMGVDGCSWSAREALAFVNGTSASLALVCHNHWAIMHLARALGALTGRIACLLGVDPMPYSPGVAEVRGHGGHIDAAKWIRSELMSGSPGKSGRPLQEPYSLRCAPQVIGAVLDQLSVQEGILMREALGCTDNPITWQGNVLHGGNFHALPVALCSDQQALGVHQLAFLAAGLTTGLAILAKTEMGAAGQELPDGPVELHREIGRKRHGRQHLAQLRGHALQRGGILDIHGAQQRVDARANAPRLAHSLVRRDREHEAGRYRQLGAHHLAEVGALAADDGDVRPVDLGQVDDERLMRRREGARRGDGGRGRGSDRGSHRSSRNE